MFTRILYPTDFSDCSKKALEYVKELKEAGTMEVIVLHVIDEREIETASTTIAWLGETVEEYEEQLINEMRSSAEEKLNAINEELASAGIKANVRLIRGMPFKEILRIAETEDISLIVIGSHGKSNVEEMLLGSVSEKVIRKSERPVLVVKR